ncbi:PadR family transcriptional regulator [Parvibaculum sp.]|uniref:PadR family transcriptional regulator n=1 Tax=Parvibaculum sp. TaxID=2024848 RepID=UPI001DCBDC6D|nr:PadR family transcriptional regulator [Parvibaculum sp.]MBX3487819.1 PadR family transcriptional regulator [Parvibaculum sp.]MCW5728189.1 PadR family transcriptional regulator [Parvibaculum sp.]
MNTKELLLSVLMGGPATGYDIKKVMEHDVSTLVDVSLSNLYPALNELAAEGLVTFRKVEQDNRPNKKIYELTAAGQEACLRALMKGDARHRLRSEFIFILSFVPFLPRWRVKELLDQRLADTNAVLEDLDRRDAEDNGTLREGQRFCIGFGRAMMEAQRDYIIAHGAELLDSCPDENPLRAVSAD